MEPPAKKPRPEPPVCSITRYDCATAIGRANINRLYAIAEEQQSILQQADPSKRDLRSVPHIRPFDPRVLPWTLRCDNHTKNVSVRHYVAQKPDGTICGWLVSETRNRFGAKYVYLSEISAIRIKSDEHKGIGVALHNELLRDARADAANFIYLYPLTDRVAEVYRTWGYETPEKLRYGHDPLKQMFLLLNDRSGKNQATIPGKLLDRLMPPHPATLIEDATKIAAGNEELLGHIKANRRNCIQDEECRNELRDALETIQVFTDTSEGDEAMTREEQHDMLMKVFAPKGGGRRTRRTFRRPRLMSRKYCKKTPCRRMGFTQRASCRPYKNCYRSK